MGNFPLYYFANPNLRNCIFDLKLCFELIPSSLLKLYHLCLLSVNALIRPEAVEGRFGGFGEPNRKGNVCLAIVEFCSCTILHSEMSGPRS